MRRGARADGDGGVVEGRGTDNMERNERTARKGAVDLTEVEG